jgi:accessory gene regulator protein AgrB
VSHLFKKVQFNNSYWLVFYRIIAALVGGYALATTSSLLISQLLMPVVGKYQAIHIGLLLSFLIYACAAMWVFSVVSAKSAWLGLIKLNVIFLGLTLLLMQLNS